MKVVLDESGFSSVQRNVYISLVGHSGSSHFVQTSVAHAQGEVHNGVVLFLVFLRPRQSCHGTQGMDFQGGPFRAGPDRARATTKVREVARGEASWE